MADCFHLSDLVAPVFLGDRVAYGDALCSSQNRVEVGVLQERMQVAVRACYQTNAPVDIPEQRQSID